MNTFTPPEIEISLEQYDLYRIDSEWRAQPIESTDTNILNGIKKASATIIKDGAEIGDILLCPKKGAPGSGELLRISAHDLITAIQAETQDSIIRTIC